MAKKRKVVKHKGNSWIKVVKGKRVKVTRHGPKGKRTYTQRVVGAKKRGKKRGRKR